MTDHFNALRGTLTSGGTGNVTVSNSASGRALPLTALPVGWSGGLRFDDAAGTAWELSQCTVVSIGPTVVSRDVVLAGSNGASKVDLTSGMTVQQVLTAEQCNAFLSVTDIAFSASIPLTRPGNSYMATKTVSGALTFTPAAAAVRGALVYLRCIADGSNLPVYSAFKEWGGSSGYDNRAGIENQMQFFFDGFNYWVSISQAIGATAVPLSASAVTLAGPSAGVINTVSTAFTVGVSPVGGAITGSIVVTPTPVTGVTFAPTSLTLNNGTTSGTFTATSTTTGAKSIAVTNNGGLTNPSAITWSVAAAATVPSAPTIGTATAGDGYVDVAFTRNSNGGSAVLDSTATLSTGQTGTGSTSPIRVSAPNGTAVTATVKDRNAVGQSAASASSNSVTPATASLRLGTLSAVTEAGSAGSYTYTGTGGGFGSEGRSVLNKTFQSGVDGEYVVKLLVEPVDGGVKELFLGCSASGTPPPYSGLPYAVVSHPVYTAFSNGGPGASSSFNAHVNDYVKIARVGSTLTFYASSNSGSTYTQVAVFTGVSTGVLYIHNLLAGPMQIQPISSVGLA